MRISKSRDKKNKNRFWAELAKYLLCYIWICFGDVRTKFGSQDSERFLCLGYCCVWWPLRIDWHSRWSFVHPFQEHAEPFQSWSLRNRNPLDWEAHSNKPLVWKHKNEMLIKISSSLTSIHGMNGDSCSCCNDCSGFSKPNYYDFVH